MSNDIKYHPQPIYPLSPSKAPGKMEQTKKAGEAFQDIFKENLNKASDIKFSAHAMKRLEERQLGFEKTDISKIKEAVNKARNKGAESSLLLYGDVALVASVKNNTIITALDKQGMKDHVFTGIDSAVIIEK
ncbi:TIGR02530 family flagellar biosynthesis protein [Candidatus Contubernalis alkaliaceticus]|uniref:TIGR02530 family flagellar biosynthesis protein n=1 Tax=Candidatus Contubernalis alkaliaceticus TaxID=338645 RepID=UPI001F4C203B|nr:TIGR02530 family flagellar biosynthesis protein [Candidatus Contubernalis alkalaceticus]UNC91750.1 flagellar biosynthesis protein [Candidatus Contubernalis alkalaceticus]